MKNLDIRVGKKLKVREDLVIGECYKYSKYDDDFEVFIREMDFQKGREVCVLAIEYNENGSPAFICDQTGCLYTLEMFDL